MLTDTITAQEAADYSGWYYSSCYRALVDLNEFLGMYELNMKKLGGFFSEFFHLSDIKTDKKMKNIPHKKGAGTTDKAGKPKRRFFFPRHYSINALFSKETFHAFDERALESNKLYNACVAKTKYVGKSIKGSCREEAKRLNRSRSTVRKWQEITKISRQPWIIETQLSKEQIADLPNSYYDFNNARRTRKQWFGHVHTKQGETRLAYKNQILGKIPSKTAYDSSGQFIYLPPLSGHLYYWKRVGTTFTDMGGWVYRVVDQ